MKLEEHPTVQRYREKSRQEPKVQPLDAGWIKKLAPDAGADDAGLVEVTRPALANQLNDIRAAFPDAKALVSLVCRTNPENIRCTFRGVPNNDFCMTSKDVDAAARRLTKRLAPEGVRCLAPPASFPMDADRWPGKMWPVSHKPVAEQAGLGMRGHHRNLIHPRFGNFVALGTLVLDREASAYDQPLDYNPCIGCRLCVAVCPVGAVAVNGHFSFANCSVHNYRYRLAGFVDWVESIADSSDRVDYRQRVSDPETVSMWQGLTYSISNTCSNCVAVCPVGEDVIGPYIEDRKGYSDRVAKTIRERGGQIFVVPGSDAEAHALKYAPERIKRVGSGRRPSSTLGFLSTFPYFSSAGRPRGSRSSRRRPTPAPRSNGATSGSRGTLCCSTRFSGAFRAKGPRKNKGLGRK